MELRVFLLGCVIVLCLVGSHASFQMSASSVRKEKGDKEEDKKLEMDKGKEFEKEFEKELEREFGKDIAKKIDKEKGKDSQTEKKFLTPTLIRESNTKTLKKLERISNQMSYTVYSAEIAKGFASYTLDPSEASLALQWRKTVKKFKRTGKANRTVRDVDEEAEKFEGGERIERDVYGHDTRSILLSPTQKRMFPFSAVVNVYPGCSGTVIGQRYVLTAAECVHDGNALLTDVDKLRIGHYNQQARYNPYEDDQSPNKAVIWYKVDKVFIPNGWRWHLDSDRYNYAVLRVAGGHFNSCMGVEGNVNIPLTKPNRVHFSSFEAFYHRGDPLLMYRYCKMEKSSAAYVYERCDTTPAALGAGMYFRFWMGPHRNWDRKVIAVKSNRKQQVEVKGTEGTVEAGRDLRITPLVFAQICFWVSDDPKSCGKGSISDQCLKDTMI